MKMKVVKQKCEIIIESGARDNLVDIAIKFTPAIDMKNNAKNHRGVMNVAFAMMDFVNNKNTKDKYTVSK